MTATTKDARLRNKVSQDLLLLKFVRKEKAILYFSGVFIHLKWKFYLSWLSHLMSWSVPQLLTFCKLTVLVFPSAILALDSSFSRVNFVGGFFHWCYHHTSCYFFSCWCFFFWCQTGQHHRVLLCIEVGTLHRLNARKVNSLLSYHKPWKSASIVKYNWQGKKLQVCTLLRFD